MKDPGIIRNRLKIAATIGNARAFLAVQKECGTFDRLHLVLRRRQTEAQSTQKRRAPSAQTPEAEAMSKDLKKRGFRFVGPTICYAFMQAVGMVDDHSADCFRSKRR